MGPQAEYLTIDFYGSDIYQLGAKRSHWQLNYALLPWIAQQPISEYLLFFVVFTEII
jgi:hypothetical protein